MSKKVNKILPAVLAVTVFAACAGGICGYAQDREPDSPAVQEAGENAAPAHQSMDEWVPVESIDFSSKHDVMIQNEDGTLSPMDMPYFVSTEVAPGTWQILSDGDYMYLVEGDDEAILIDTGYGAGNIRTYCQTLTDKPLKYVINTHYHFDHTANNAYFECAYMSADSVDHATIPYSSFSGIAFPRDYPVEIVGDGYTFDLGSRTLEVFEIPNHTPGGIALLDRKERILFSGDEIMKPDSISLNCSVELFEESMSKLAAHRSEFDRCCGGPGIVDASAIDNFLANAQYILSGNGTPQPVSLSDGGGKKTNQSQNQNQTAGESAGQTVYVRKRVRPDDRAASVEDQTKIMVQMTYSDCTITYDSGSIRKSGKEDTGEELYEKGWALRDSDPVQAFNYYMEGAGLGHGMCMACVGDAYENGKGVGQDYEKAIEWYEKAVLQGANRAMLNLGIIYYEGTVVNQDYEKAYELFDMAWEIGKHSKAPRYLGIFYEEGLGVEQNFDKAKEYYQLAIDEKDTTAKCRLGRMYELGLGVEQSYETALKYYQDATGSLEEAAKNVIPRIIAVNGLGRFYANGLGGLEKDRDLAAAWYGIAAQAGDEDAAAALNELQIQ